MPSITATATGDVRSRFARRRAELRAELRAALAVARTDGRIHLRYPVDLASILLNPLYQFLIPSFLLGTTFLVGGRALGLERTAGTSDIGGFLFVGVVVIAPIFGAGWGAAFTFRRELDAGTFEPVWLTPTGRATFVLGHALWSLVLSACGSVALLAIGAIFFGVRLRPEIVIALPGLALALVALLGIAYVIAAAVLLVKEPGFLVDVTTFLVAALSGVYFPVAVLPDAIRVIALALPTTYALDLLRSLGIGARPLLPLPLEYAVVTVLALLLLPLGRALFLATDHHLRRTGSLGQY